MARLTLEQLEEKYESLYVYEKVAFAKGAKLVVSLILKLRSLVLMIPRSFPRRKEKNSSYRSRRKLLLMRYVKSMLRLLMRSTY